MACFFLILVILIQPGKSGGLGIFGSAGAQQVFGGRGAGNFLTKTTWTTAAIFFFTSISLAYLSSSSDEALQKRSEAAQKAKESRRKTSNVVIKEMKYRPKIGGGDFDTKTRKVEHFLAEGHKVKVTLTFRGREVYHPELGKKILDQVEEAVKDVGRVEIFPRIDGRNMTMVLAPDKRAQAAKQKADAAAAAEADADSEAPATDQVTDAPEPEATTEAPAAPDTSEVSDTTEATEA